MLVFEDLHWADAESIALFGRLAVTPVLPLLLVGTIRPQGVDRRHPLVELLADLERQRSVTTSPSTASPARAWPPSTATVPGALASVGADG